MTFRGYQTPGQSDAKFTADGRWYLTGDAGRVDADGDFFFSSRDDDVIIMAGYRIGPFEIESVLAQHPAVAECSVIGAPDDVRGEVIEAYVVLRGGSEATPALATELQQLVKTRYAAHAYPRTIHFIDALPKTPSGKTQRYLLRRRRHHRQRRRAPRPPARPGGRVQRPAARCGRARAGALAPAHRRAAARDRVRRHRLDSRDRPRSRPARHGGPHLPSAGRACRPGPATAQDLAAPHRRRRTRTRSARGTRHLRRQLAGQLGGRRSATLSQDRRQPMNRYHGRVVAITGGAQGLGLAMATRF